MKITVITPFNNTEWNWFGNDFGGDKFSWSIINLSLFGKKPWFWLIKSISVVRDCKESDVIISHHPYMSFYLSLALKLFGVNKPHYAFSFNHGNGRFFHGAMKRLAVHLFSNIDGFVVFSEAEKLMYSKYYQIPIEKFSFVHWAVNSPKITNKKLPKYIATSKPYICCMGRNNRDFDSLIKAVRSLDISAIIVCKTGQVDEQSLPDNIIMRTDIPMEEAMLILENSTLSLTLLKDASRGAGHINIVSAMQLGIPQIVTKVSTVKDYFTDKKHGTFVNENDTNDLIKAIKELLTSSETIALMSDEATNFSKQWLMEDSSRNFLKNYIDCIFSGRKPPEEPMGWSEFKSKNQVL